ncbi:hypothetical protein NEMIN01_0461 [Nematocida minor]|uniref:uncharacterized protein n=1 Tax=Nematocida minor TaxID=1912983 RepID=UPI002220C71B|nr:uncharacterized protein NEMIN01_0461 [Nematocida minor]KAI5189398.1 hypothetical protein NEMIN01_0461 [Nematocida minor]
MRDDCFYFMTSVCARGNSCTYRHSMAAKQSSVVCSSWKAGVECNEPCPYRHSEYQQKDKEKGSTVCYWETHGGCKKADCPFVHLQRAHSQPCLLDIQKLNYELEELNIRDYEAEKPIIVKSIAELMQELKEIEGIFHI